MTTLALAGAAIGGALLTPSVATATPTGPAPQPRLHDPEPAAHDADAPTLHALPDRDDDRDADAGPSRHQAQPAAHRSGRHHAEPRPTRAEPRHARPMTSGERQLRNNCRQGLIADHCELVDTKHLLQRGIDPSP
jgi:hypothetical protein